VTFGEQSWEEMFIGYLGYTIPADVITRDPLPESRTAEMGMGEDITPENLVGTKWRLGNRVELEFMEDGRVVANGMMPGRWEIQQNRLIVINPMQPVEIAVIGDELILMGRSMRFVREGDPPFEAWQPGQGGGGQQRGGGQRGGGQGQGPSR